MAEICMQNECDVICVQETHRDQNSIRPKIKNTKLVILRPHNKYGSELARFVKGFSQRIGSNAVQRLYKRPTYPNTTR